MLLNKLKLGAVLLAAVCGLSGCAEAQASGQCSYIVATRTSCAGDGCSYAATCRPTVCPSVGWVASKSWSDLVEVGLPPVLHVVNYKAALRTGSVYPTCNSYFNSASNWHAP